MDKQTIGWSLIGLGFFQILGLIAIDLAQLKDTAELTSLAFISKTIGHLSAVGTSALGGKMLKS